MKRFHGVLMAGLTALATMVPSAAVQADFLSLRDGTVLEGVFEGASARNFHFRVDGLVQQISITEVRSLELSPRPEAEALSAAEPKKPEQYLIVGSGPRQFIKPRLMVN